MWEVRVALDPAEAVHVKGSLGLELVLRVFVEANTLVHVDIMNRRSSLNERPVKRVAVVSDKDGWLDCLNVLEESL